MNYGFKLVSEPHSELPTHAKAMNGFYGTFNKQE
jgi:hypothetical protein